MTAPRKDVKIYLDDEVHAALKAICASKDVGLGEYIEQIIRPHVRSVVHDVMVLAAEFQRSGIARDSQESPGMARNGQESHGTGRHSS
jgi:hypothetical protein